ncbi:MAG: hypothetical protein R3Y55_03320 [Rikenellaceae bacterium]
MRKERIKENESGNGGRNRIKENESGNGGRNRIKEDVNASYQVTTSIWVQTLKVFDKF